MEIKNYLKQLDPYRAQLEKTESPPAKTRKEKAREAAPASGDRVSLSTEAKLRTEAYSTALSAPDVRHEKVQAIKERVDAGEYQIDTRKVAAKILAEESDLFS